MFYSFYTIECYKFKRTSLTKTKSRRQYKSNEKVLTPKKICFINFIVVGSLPNYCDILIHAKYTLKLSLI